MRETQTSPTVAACTATRQKRKVIRDLRLSRRPPRRNLNPAASLEALIRDSASRHVDREIDDLQRRGIEVLRIEPGPDELAVTGPDPMDPSFCVEIANRAAHHARLRARDLGLIDLLRHRAA